MKTLLVDGDIVYIIERIKVPRGIRRKGQSKADEVTIRGFNKRYDPKLWEKVKAECNWVDKDGVKYE